MRSKEFLKGFRFTSRFVIARVAVNILCVAFLLIVFSENSLRPSLTGLLNPILYVCSTIIFRSSCFALFDIADAHLDRLEMKLADRKRHTARAAEMAMRKSQRKKMKADVPDQPERPEAGPDKDDHEHHDHEHHDHEHHDYEKLESGVPDIPTDEIGSDRDPKGDWKKYKV